MFFSFSVLSGKPNYAHLRKLPDRHHPEITPGQARLTLEFFVGGLLEKNVYLDGMSILLILLSLEPGCHNSPPP
jgi:hypothetical protein